MFVRLLAVTAFGCAIAPSARAWDLGDPTFPEPQAGITQRVEFFYATTDRALRIDLSPLGRGPAGSGPQAFAPRAGYRSRFEEDQIVARYTYWAAPMVALQFDLGLGGKTNKGDDVAFLGASAKTLLSATGPFQLTGQVFGVVRPEVGFERSGVSQTLGPFIERQETQAYEAGGALLLSARHDFAEALEGTLYTGIEASMYRDTGDGYAHFSDTNERIWFSGIAKEQSLWRTVVGSKLAVGDHCSLRTEARIAEYTEFSVGLSWRW
ncbi:MAG: hypothetical protein AAF805_09095 [Planctomycetota bacterium]